MKRWSMAISASLLLLNQACSSESTSSDPLIHQDFEKLVGWVGLKADLSPEALLTTRTAHSGQYAARVGGVVEYGFSYLRPLGDLVKVRPKKLKLSVWCYKQDKGGDAASLILNIERGATAQRLATVSFDLSTDLTEENKWVKLSKVIDVPAEVDFSDQLRIYLWRNSATSDVYFDDMEVQVVN